jgi:hypothetical protein
MSGPVVMYSSGLSSFAAALRARDAHEGVRLLFCDTKAEDTDNYRFLRESVTAIGLPLVTVADGRTPWEVAHAEHMIPNTRAKICSRVLKHEPAKKWLDANALDALIVLGIGWSETHRLAGIAAGHAPREVWAPLTEPPYLERDDLMALSRSLGIEPPRMYSHGYAHANCAGGCFLAGQAAWRHLLLDSPEAFAKHEVEEEKFRAERGDFSVLRDRTGGTTKPLPLTVLRRRVESDGQVDLFDWGGCGCTSGDAA